MDKVSSASKPFPAGDCAPSNLGKQPDHPAHVQFSIHVAKKYLALTCADLFIAVDMGLPRGLTCCSIKILK